MWWMWLPRLDSLLTNVPITEGNYHEAPWLRPIMAFSDRYGHIVWPLVGLAVVVAIALAVLKSASHQSIPGPQRSALKREIVHELRRNLKGMHLKQIAAYVNQPAAPLAELLAEMAKDGMIRATTNDTGEPIFKLPGF